MRKLFVILTTLFLYLPALGQAAQQQVMLGNPSRPANGNFGQVVQSKTASSGSDTSISATFDTAVTAGNLIVAIHFTGDSDSQAGSGLTEAIANTDATNSDQMAIYFRVVQSGDGTSWGAGSANADQHVLIIAEIRGPFAASPLDASATEPAASGVGTMPTGTTGATAQNDEIAISAVSYRGATVFPNLTSWSNSFTALGEVGDGTVGGNGFKAVMGAMKVLTATGAQSSTATFETDPTPFAMGAIATFKKQ